MGLVAGILALCWFSQIEMMDFPALNSWIILNLPDGDPSIVTGKLRILFVVAVVIATAFSVTRLLPKRWTLLKRPLHERTWPSILVCLLVLVSWYIAAQRVRIAFHCLSEQYFLNSPCYTLRNEAFSFMRKP
jgi:hypothetical protein